MTIDIVTSPIFNCKGGIAKKAIVIRCVKNGSEFVVHNKYYYSDNTIAYGDGNYFCICSYESTGKAYEAAFKKWLERVNKASEMYGILFPITEEAIEIYEKS